MFLSLINPFVYGNDSDVPVNSSVLNLNLEICSISVNKTKPQPLGNGSLSAPFEMTLIPKDIPSPSLMVNVTPNNPHRLIFHTFNVSDPPYAVQFNLYPVNLNETFEIYVLLDRLP